MHWKNPHPYQYNPSEEYGFTLDKEIPADNDADGIIMRWDTTISTEDFKAASGLLKSLYRHTAQTQPSTKKGLIIHTEEKYLYRYVRGCGCKGAPQKCI